LGIFAVLESENGFNFTGFPILSFLSLSGLLILSLRLQKHLAFSQLLNPAFKLREAV
jgi:hypothetical protein